MNKYSRREAKLAKRLAGTQMKGSPLSKFRIARRYVRACLYNRHQQFLDWYLKRIK